MEHVIYLALPGYVAVLTIRLFSRSRAATGWDFLISTGVLGAISFVVARTIVLFLIQFAILQPYIRIMNGIVDRWISSASFAGTYLLSWILAPLIGYLCVQFFHGELFSSLLLKLNADHLPKNWDSLVQIRETLHPVVVSTNTGQIYIGKVRRVTDDPNESLRILEIFVFLSGSRIDSEEGKRVKYNYGFDVTENDFRVFFLDFRNIVSIAEFGWEQFIQTRNNKYTEISDELLLQLIRNLIRQKYLTEAPPGLVIQSASNS